MQIGVFMTNLTLYRKRIIPNECVLLKNDCILQCNNDTIITKWNALKPKKDLHHGFSCYYLNEGFKISKFYREDGTLLYWYCDIVEYEYHADKQEYIITDLLADVIIYPDGLIKVIDLDELVAAFDANLITDYQIKKALLNLNNLLSTVYSPRFKSIKSYLEQYE